MSYDAGPVAALRRIAFLLERGREETYKVKAYRNAAAAILPLGDDAVRAAVEAGTITDIPGVGASTAKAITSAVRGETPARLAELEAEHGGPLTQGGQELHALLKGDLHSHSDWSDGGSPIEEMAFTAIELGHEYQVLTDHSPRLRVANGLSAERLQRQLGVVDAVNEHLDASGAGSAFTLLKGIEVDILDDGALDQSDEMLAQLDVRVASVHSKLRDGLRADDQADGRGGPQPVHQRPRPLHRPDGDGCAGRSAPRRSSTRRPSSRRASSTTSPSRSTPARSAGTRRPSSSSWPATWAASSRSTPTRTRRDSSTSSGTARSGPRPRASTRTGS